MNKNISETIGIFLIRVYQSTRVIRNMMLLSVFGAVSECKHHPSCSEYAIQQIKKHGTMRGLARGIRQLASCR